MSGTAIGIVLERIRGAMTGLRDQLLPGDCVALLTSPRVRILDEVLQERERQIAKWKDEENDRELFLMLAVLGEEVGECQRAGLEMHRARRNADECAVHEANLREELIQTAAVAMKLVEMLDAERLYLSDPCEDAGAVDANPRLEVPRQARDDNRGESHPDDNAIELEGNAS